MPPMLSTLSTRTRGSVHALRASQPAVPPTVCAWCRTTMLAGSAPDAEVRANYGMCRRCLSRALRALEGLRPRRATA